MPNSHRRPGRLHASACVLIGTLLAGYAQHALTGPAHAQTAFTSGQKEEKPTEAEIDRALTDLLLCEWMTETGSSLGAERFSQVLNYLKKDTPARGRSELEGTFQVIGHVFQRIVTAGGPVSGGAVGWSATSSADSVVRTLQERGYTFEPMTDPMVGFSGKMIRGSVQYDVWVGHGHYTFGRQRATEGVTLTCGARLTEEALHKKMLEAQKQKRIYDRVVSRQRQPSEWAEAILDDGKLEELEILASYTWLSAEQIGRLVESDAKQVREALIKNTTAPLNTAQLDRLLGLRHHESVIRYRYGALTEEQRRSLLDKAETRSLSRLAEGSGGALEELEKTLRTGNLQETMLAFETLRTITPEITDLVLRAGNRAAVAHFLYTYRPRPTPDQINRMLASDDPGQHAWLVRKNDFPLTRAQYERGVMHPDEGISFWYRFRKDHTPSPQMIEEGLSSPNERTRQLWLMQERISLTPAQVVRGLNDPSERARHAAYARKDVTLTPAQLDACLREAAYLTREVCVKRPELTLGTLTQERFENIVGHGNPNLFSSFLYAKGVQDADLAPYVKQAILTASDETLLRMAALRDLTITAEDVRTVRYTRSPEVQRTYCRRVPGTCPRER